VSIVQQLQMWWREQTLEDDTPFDNDSFSFFSSFITHLVVLVVLGLIPGEFKEPERKLEFVSSPPAEIEPEMLPLPQEVYFNNTPSEQVGANSEKGQFMAMAQAAVVSEVSEIPNPELDLSDVGDVQLENTVAVATGLQLSKVNVKGGVGVGTTGATGAVDRITHEIVKSLEERKTLVVWLFDQSPSMIKQRATVNDRFSKIYQELGVVEAAGMEAFKKHEDKPLLTSVVAFGNEVKLLTEKPTDDLATIQKAVSDIPYDSSGEEYTFTAIQRAVNEYKHYRIPPGVDRGEPDRNVMIVVFTDEVGTDQYAPQTGIDATVKLCKRYAVPIYVVGVPAPFGTQKTQVKWIDPDPKFDQTPGWGEVEQGPESIYPERLRLSSSTSQDEEDAIDSGFGPYALTRLCYETGGIYFSVHPNRDVNRMVSRNQVEPYSAHIKYFFDQEVMRKYKPDYVSLDEYMRRLKQNKCREVLVTAARETYRGAMESPRLRFVKFNEADFAADVSEAQKAAASLEPKLARLLEILKPGEADREKESSPRWQAGFDLAMGRIMAANVRTTGYNAMLATAKRGMKFKDDKNNTWIIEPSAEISVGSLYQKMGDKAKMYLERVVNDHPNTPWALLAKKELDQPLGWAWKEEFTAPPMPGNPGDGNGNPNPNAEKMMRPPTRAVPKKL
jgi:von Willebrand factor type A domain